MSSAAASLTADQIATSAFQAGTQINLLIYLAMKFFPQGLQGLDPDTQLDLLMAATLPIFYPVYVQVRLSIKNGHVAWHTIAHAVKEFVTGLLICDVLLLAFYISLGFAKCLPDIRHCQLQDDLQLLRDLQHDGYLPRSGLLGAYGVAQAEPLSNNAALIAVLVNIVVFLLQAWAFYHIFGWLTKSRVSVASSKPASSSEREIAFAKAELQASVASCPIAG